jgi:hypothetical protein
MPRHVMAVAYSVTLFRHSVLTSSVILCFRHHQFPFIILVTAAHIQLKFDIWICHEKVQVKFKFGHGSMILAELCPYYFEKKCNLHFPFIISPAVQHIQLKFDIWLCHEKIQFKFELGHGSMIFGRVMPLLLWKW